MSHEWNFSPPFLHTVKLENHKKVFRKIKSSLMVFTRVVQSKYTTNLGYLRLVVTDIFDTKKLIQDGQHTVGKPTRKILKKCTAML